MDRSFLTNDQVVKASRNFVCIRLATYEDAQEAEFLKSLFLSQRSGELENTTFCILSPDGQTRLSRSGRGPHFAYRDAADMARSMNDILLSVTEDEQPFHGSRLPVMKSVDLAINVASCDGLPLVVIYANDNEAQNRCEKKLNELAWNDKFSGQFIYAITDDPADLKPLVGQQSEEGIYFVEPGSYGLSGKTLNFVGLDASLDSINTHMTSASSHVQAYEKTHDSHVRAGIQLGIEWDSKIPETDPMSIEARRRARGK